MQRSVAISRPLDLNRGEMLPLLAAFLLVAALAVCNLTDNANLGIALLIAPVGALLILQRPEYGVIIMFSSFLVTYPKALAGSGMFTLNNALAGLLGLLLVLRMVRDGDWSFLRRREVLILAAIGAIYLLSRWWHQPDSLTMSLASDELRAGDQDPARMWINRFLFFTFFVAFVHSSSNVRTLFTLTITLMVLSSMAGIWYVIAGWGFAGYRARSAFFIGTAGNPNRMGLFAVIAFAALWYLAQRRPSGLMYAIVLPLMAITVLSVFMTGSRSSVAGLALGSTILFLEGGVSVRKIGVVLLAGVMAIGLISRMAPEKSVERATGGGGDTDLGSGSYERRAYGAGFAFELAGDNPIFGVGIGNWEITRYLADPAHTTAPPHSSYLLALVEGGVVTLSLYLALLGMTMQNFIRFEAGVRSGLIPKQMHWMASTMRTGFVVFLFFSLVGDLWLHIIFYWFIGLGVAMRHLLEKAERGSAAEVFA